MIRKEYLQSVVSAVPYEREIDLLINSTTRSLIVCESVRLLSVSEHIPQVVQPDSVVELSFG